MAPGSTERAADLQTGARDHLKGEKQGSQSHVFKHEKGSLGRACGHISFEMKAGSLILGIFAGFGNKGSGMLAPKHALT